MRRIRHNCDAEVANGLHTHLTMLNQRPFSVALTCLLACAGVSLAGNAAADEPAPPCRTSIDYPLDGQTAVPATAVIRGTSTCRETSTPFFTDDSGVRVEATFVVTASDTGLTFKLTPKAPLDPDRTFTVAFADGSTCGEPHGKATFSTAPRPGIRAVRHDGDGEALHALTISLTEPVLHPADLAIFLSVSIDGFEGAGAIFEQGSSAEEIVFTFKSQPPPLTQTVRVRLDAGLDFASGVELPEDVEVAYIPDEMPWGWSVTGSTKPCPDQASGCHAGRAPIGGAPWALVGAGAAVVLSAVRRRTGAARKPV